MPNKNFEEALAAYKINPTNENTVAVLKARIALSQEVADRAIAKYEANPNEDTEFWCRFHVEARDKEYVDCMMLIGRYA